MGGHSLATIFPIDEIISVEIGYLLTTGGDLGGASQRLLADPSPAGRK
jgi:hypothetical protein